MRSLGRNKIDVWYALVDKETDTYDAYGNLITEHQLPSCGEDPNGLWRKGRCYLRNAARLRGELHHPASVG